MQIKLDRLGDFLGRPIYHFAVVLGIQSMMNKQEN